jgi:hypothetical protein
VVLYRHDVICRHGVDKYKFTFTFFTTAWQTYAHTLSSIFLSIAVDMLSNWDESNQAKLIPMLANFCKS